jgi:hypothetical protein
MRQVAAVLSGRVVLSASIVVGAQAVNFISLLDVPIRNTPFQVWLIVSPLSDLQTAASALQLQQGIVRGACMKGIPAAQRGFGPATSLHFLLLRSPQPLQ